MSVVFGRKVGSIMFSKRQRLCFLRTKVIKVFGDGFGLLGRGFALVEEDLWLLEDVLTELLDQSLVWHRCIRCHFLCVVCVFLLRSLVALW